MNEGTDEPRANIEIYSSMLCPYCHAARQLLDSKGIEYTVLGVDGKPSVRAEMSQRADGRTSVPQVFANGTPLGGYDDISALERAGKLDAALGLTATP